MPTDVKVTVNQGSTKNFSMGELLINDDGVILLSDGTTSPTDFRATVISKGNGYHNIGFYATGWPKASYKNFRGTIQLTSI